MRLTICIPVFNEQESLPELLRRTRRVLDDLGEGPHEIIVVDDGSTDGTVDTLMGLAQAETRLRIIVLSRNFGQQAALSAALDHAQGDAVVLMDADLQDEPEVISRFVELYREGADVVYARRSIRHENALLRAAYRVSYRIIAALSNVQIPVDSGDFSLLSRKVVEAVRRLPERQRYLRGLRAWVGFRQVGIDVVRPARAAGVSKYGLRALAGLAFDGMFAFSTIPLRAAAAVGACAIALSVTFGLYAIYVRLVVGAVPAGFTASLLLTIFLAGVQLLFLGVIGEYVGRVYEETKNRPTYVIARIIGGR